MRAGGLRGREKPVQQPGNQRVPDNMAFRGAQRQARLPFSPQNCLSFLHLHIYVAPMSLRWHVRLSTPRSQVISRAPYVVGVVRPLAIVPRIPLKYLFIQFHLGKTRRDPGENPSPRAKLVSACEPIKFGKQPAAAPMLPERRSPN